MAFGNMLNGLLCINFYDDKKKIHLYSSKIFISSACSKNNEFKYFYGFRGMCLKPVDSISPKTIFIF